MVTTRNPLVIFVSGALVGILGGLIGLGGAEFRLPLLIGLFGFGALEAILLNKATSLIVVAVALPFRASAVPLGDLLQHLDVVGTLLAGSSIGASCGAAWAATLKSRTLYRVIALLLLAISVVLVLGHGHASAGPAFDDPVLLRLTGFAAGLIIGAVASLLGVAGGELLIPTIVLLFGVELKLAGSLSLAVSLPTMIIGFSRYSRDRSFEVIGRQKTFLAIMAAGSVLGAFVGSRLLGIIPTDLLLGILATILGLSAIKLGLHREPDSEAPPSANLDDCKPSPGTTKNGAGLPNS